MAVTNSYISHLYCPKCAKTYAPAGVLNLCACGSPLLVQYDLARAAREVDKGSFVGRTADLWRYKEFLPVLDSENIVSLGEGFTPLLPLDQAGKSLGLDRLYLKDEGIIPTGSFKARGAAVAVSRAKELGIKTLIMPTNGNAGAAWALYSARAGIRATIIMPEDAPRITRLECAIAGADLYLVKGLISDCGKIVARSVKRHAADKHPWYDVSTLKEPYRIEGKKTMGYEIAEQFGWQSPDVILYPTGGGVGIIGIYKAFCEMRELGWLNKLPRLVAVQAENCAPIVRAFKDKKPDSIFWENSSTVAFGINVPKALGDFLVLEAIYKTNGCAVSVTDQEIILAQRDLAQKEGAFICPEGAALYAAVKNLRQDAWLGQKESVVLLNTGAGIKYPDTQDFVPPYLELDAEL
ncbi:MAG: threonine synthase [Deltaproteobacteria bacterium]|jgi:threonine synthase|nr:threonine synthase [Deltaproteobacteria bacterium]